MLRDPGVVDGVEVAAVGGHALPRFGRVEGTQGPRRQPLNLRRPVLGELAERARTRGPGNDDGRAQDGHQAPRTRHVGAF